MPSSPRQKRKTPPSNAENSRKRARTQAREPVPSAGPARVPASTAPPQVRTVPPKPLGSALAPGSRPRPATHPLAGKGKVKPLRSNFLTDVHDDFHFKPTIEKSHHGVWQTESGLTRAEQIKQVTKWVRQAIVSIMRYSTDDSVVNFKAIQGGYAYLVDMKGLTVGFLSGSKAPPGEKPPATHVEVWLDHKGNTITAFPSDPRIF
jgi:hypothetical protein